MMHKQNTHRRDYQCLSDAIPLDVATEVNRVEFRRNHDGHPSHEPEV